MLSLCRRKCDFLVLLLAASRVTSTCLKFAVGERKKAWHVVSRVEEGLPRMEFVAPPNPCQSVRSRAIGREC